MGLVRFVYLLAVAVWIGEIVCFSFLIAPAIFGVLGPARAGDLVAAIFPRYYALGMGAGTVALATGLVLARGAVAAGWWRAACVALVLGLAATVYAGVVVEPRARTLRAAMQAAGEGSPAAADFRALHGRAVMLNGAALLAGLVGLALSAGALHE